MQVVLDYINQGFIVFDNDFRLVVWNCGFYDMFDMLEEIVCWGVYLEVFIWVNVECGEYGLGDIEGKILC